MKQETNFLNTFWGGLLMGVMAICTIGFVVLLIMYFGGNNLGGGNKLGSGAPTGQGAPVGNQPTTGGDIQLAAITDDDHIRGNKDAKITIVEFSDLECPFCNRFHNTMKQVISEYGEDVRWVYKHAPLDSLHRKARIEAEASECAWEQGGNDAFWAYIDRIFELSPGNDGLDLAMLPQIAVDLGLNRDTFQSCLDSGKYADKVQGHLDEATAAGLRGTPYSVIFVGDQKIPIPGALPFEQIRSMISPFLN